MFRQIIQQLLYRTGFARHTASEAVAAYEAAHGHPSNKRETREFEAASWLIASNQKPETALKRFEQENSSPCDGLDELTFEGVRSWLRRWAREESQISSA
ncbi:MAG TPA: hypothetical protein VMR75_03065 [Candidatus Saccharimonadales bacterium]|nr:hypothetical protein [Candidatus Saccharimonadales bacterium]